MPEDKDYNLVAYKVLHRYKNVNGIYNGQDNFGLIRSDKTLKRLDSEGFVVFINI